MVHEIEGQSIDQIAVQLARTMLDKGHYNNPRGKKTLEIDDAFLTLKDPTKNVISNEARGTDLEYLRGELDWYLNGTYDADGITEHSSFWENLTDRNGTVNSNYGMIALKEKYNGKSQFNWCVDKLNEDRQSRQAVINYNQPEHKYDGNRDFVCTMYQQFRSNDGKNLDSTVSMRSNDFIFGATYDIPFFTMIQQGMCFETDTKLGDYKHHAGSMHVYERHFDMLEDIAKTGEVPDSGQLMAVPGQEYNRPTDFYLDA